MKIFRTEIPLARIDPTDSRALHEATLIIERVAMNKLEVWGMAQRLTVRGMVQVSPALDQSW